MERADSKTQVRTMLIWRENVSLKKLRLDSYIIWSYFFAFACSFSSSRCCFYNQNKVIEYCVLYNDQKIAKMIFKRKCNVKVLFSF